MNTTFTTAACALILSVFSTMTNAALIDRGGGLIYDTDMNITWLQNANLAKTNTFGVLGINQGIMNWATAQNWIGAMNTANYLGYNDWRLPTTMQPDTTCQNQSIYGDNGYFCSGSEMGHLYYNELGGTTPNGTIQNVTTYTNSNLALFQNVQSNAYWSGTPYAMTTSAWWFTFNGGAQDAFSQNNDILFAWAVRTGDVAAVPVPATAWLFGSGLLSLLGISRRKAL